MKRYGIFVLVIFFLASFAFLGVKIVGAQTSSGKIAYIDEDQLLRSYPPFMNAYTKYQQEYQNRLNKLSEAQKAGKSQDELKKLSTQYDTELEPYKKAVDGVLQSLKKTLDKIFADLSKKEGYIAVLTKNIQGQDVVIWGGVDITDKVINILAGKQ
ncbi:MAG TPA: OmpH family outer membrane protein [Dictyoglomaceae bacterium]|nr:OmpH family outer membrane protein [Dictyoglomaceae bacterium]HOL39743.1 OmpH family outer membrane protein [Dictyoglomaceae bacterium]HPP16125.1 OmpH family outer membrane protein [Dictyoglomaceae bacterium]